MKIKKIDLKDVTISEDHGMARIRVNRTIRDGNGTLLTHSKVVGGDKHEKH
jgi:hypothetical protein